ncbi:MAG: methionyl-tRNA formyltransferase [Peptococcaceae bacterium]|jgi:methionyl-tRNA formyltransferase|nr:methionyl-tRNA formyltransferase [Peptococcaceae bacterium]
MRVLLIGQDRFGRDCLQNLVGQGEQVVGVITVPEGKKPNPLQESAVEQGLPLIMPARLKDEGIVEWAAGLGAELAVLAYVTGFVPAGMIRLFPRGAINYHPSLLPGYRGGSAIARAIIAGEKETGVTVHYIDEGVDTGDIILQQSVPISPVDNTVTLYFDKLYPLGLALLSEAVRLIGAGRAPRIPQDERLASFHPVLKEADARIDWRQAAGRIHDLVRGAMPSPGAGTTFRGEKVVIYEAAGPAEGGSGAAPGRIQALGGDGLLVGTGRGDLLVRKVVWRGRRVAAPEFAGSSALQVGEAFV